jgi:uncharacterized protein YjbI with pentapeptide repeats
MKIEIKHRFNGTVLFSCEANNIKETVEQAVKTGANLSSADLQGADLQGAYLRGAYLRGAYLQGAYLQGADLRGADLQGADLRCADLRGADLRVAYLRGAYLRCADLQGADLRCADLQGADLQGADLRGADLRCADLRCADLRGADLRDKVKIKGGNSVLTFIGGGSIGRAVYAFNCDVGIYIQAGCFFGTLNEFREKTLVDTNGDKTNKKAMQYLGFANIAAISFDKPEEVQV